MLTEQGEILFKTAQEMFLKLESTKLKLTDSKTRPSGELKVTTTFGLGTRWLTPRLDEFFELYPDIRLNLILTDEELDLSMREADVGLRIRPPSQPDLIQRKLFTIHFHAYASENYLKRYGIPKTAQDLDGHRLLAYTGRTPNYMQDISWLSTAGRATNNPRPFAMTHNNILALVKAVECGIGIAILPDYLISDGAGLVQIMEKRDYARD